MNSNMVSCQERATFALRALMEYKEEQRELHCVLVDLEKAYIRVETSVTSDL